MSDRLMYEANRKGDRGMKQFDEWLQDELQRLFPTDILDTLDRSRDYDGQPHTDEGERGKQEVKGLTMRDIRDCFIRGCYASSGLQPKDYPKSVYDLPWDEIDPIAVCQNMMCWIEKYMGIYPNVPELTDSEMENFLNKNTIEFPGEIYQKLGASYGEAIAIAAQRHLLKLLEERCPGHPTVNKDGATTYYGGEQKMCCRKCMAEIEKEIEG